MNRVTFTICCVLLLDSTLFAFFPIGPPSSNIEKGQFALGVDYAHIEYDLEPKGEQSWFYPEWDQTLYGNVEFGASEQKADAYLAKIVYGIADGSELFVRLGTSENSFAWGLGAKTTLAESPSLDWSIAIQANWLRSEETETVGPFYAEDQGYLEQGTWFFNNIVYGPFYNEVKVDVTAIRIYAGPVFKFEKFRFYCGPVLSWLKVDYDFEASGDFTWDIIGVGSFGSPVVWKGSYGVEDEFRLGCYIGSSVEIVENFDLVAELQQTGDSRLFGVGLDCRF